jgi:hypothetical protein
LDCFIIGPNTLLTASFFLSSSEYNFLLSTSAIFTDALYFGINSLYISEYIFPLVAAFILPLALISGITSLYAILSNLLFAAALIFYLRQSFV